MSINRQWLLANRPASQLDISHFLYNEEAQPSESILNDGEVIIENAMFLHAPTMRNWMEPPGNSLYPSMDLGSPVMAPAGGTVLASRRPGFAHGDIVTYLGHWQDYELVSSDTMLTKVPDNLRLDQIMGSLGLNARTAYFGLTRVGRPLQGETLLVSGAAGSTGSIVMQIGRILGCRTIGIAGSDEKCRWLIDQCGASGAVNYRSPGFADELRELCPSGVNVFFDNVGGDILSAAVKVMAKFGRIVLCGQIASYDGAIAKPIYLDMMRLIYGSVTMQGFLQGDFADHDLEAIDQLSEWISQGSLITREDIRHGFSELPTSFSDLFSGSNTGTLLVQI